MLRLSPGACGPVAALQVADAECLDIAEHGKSVCRRKETPGRPIACQHESPSQNPAIENVVIDLSVTSKKRVFEQAGLIFENQNGIARSTVTDNLFARERLGSTGLGEGVAIPHGGSRVSSIRSPRSCGSPTRSRSKRPTANRSGS